MLFLLFGFPADLIAADPLIEELQTKAVSAWDEFEAGLTSVQMEGSTHFREVVGKKVVRDYQREVVIAWDCSRGVALARNINGDAIDHDVTNPKAHFAVWSKGSTEKGMLREVQVRKPSNETLWTPLSCVPYRNAACEAAAGTRLGTVPMSFVVSSSDFDWIKVEEVTDSRQRFINLVLKYRGPKGSTLVPDSIYSISLDALHRYRVTNWTWEIGDNFKRETSVEYDDETLLPKTISRVTSDSLAGDVIETKFTLNSFTECRLSDEEFYLPHYGFSEKVLDTLTPNPWPRWLLVIGGIASIIIGAWLIRRRERSQFS